jgi:hypothetical protein
VNYAGSPCEVHHREGRSARHRRWLSLLRFLRLRICARKALKKERDRHVQRLAQLIEAAGADTVFGLLIFVQLLIRDAQRGGEFWLTYSQFSAPLSQAQTDMGIDPDEAHPASGDQQVLPASGYALPAHLLFGRRFGFCAFKPASADLVTSVKSWNGSVSKAREISTISSTSTRRSPRSISETKVCLLPSRCAASV